MKLKSILLAAAALVAAPAIATAQEAPEFSLSANVGVASDYVFRGVSQTNGDPQVFGGVDLGYGMFYAGTWASNVDFGDGEDLEFDIYAGVKPTLGAVSFDFGILGYLYPQDDVLNTWEAKAAATYTVTDGPSFTGSLFYSPELGKDGPSYWYYELGVSAPIPGAKLGPFGLSALASIGVSDVDGATDTVTNWKLGLTAATEAGWAVDVFYTDTDLDGVETAEGRGVVQLKKSF